MYRYAARVLCGQEVAEVPLETKRDVQEARLTLPDGRTLVFAVVGHGLIESFTPLTSLVSSNPGQRL